MADDGSDVPLDGLPLLRKALEVTGSLATSEELEEESEDEKNDETEAPEENEAPEQTEAAKSAEFITYSPVSRFPPGDTSRN